MSGNSIGPPLSSVYPSGPVMPDGPTASFMVPNSPANATTTPLGPPAPPEAPAGGGGLEGAGTALAIAGALTQTVGAFYAAKSAKYEAKAAALTLDFRSRMSMLDARAAEEHAQAILQSSRRQIGAVTMRTGQMRGQARATLAARGGQAGTGSAAESLVGIDYESKLEQFTISANAVRQAASARMGGQNARTESTFQAMSARNVTRSGQSIRPGMSAFTVALGGASTIIRTTPRDYQ